jgi:predicted nuclease of restriction endonuclease-like (RecB) superfamily
MAELTSYPKGYRDLLALLTTRIRTAQLRASIAVNQELVLLYWGIGKEILTRQREDGWGTKVIERLANDLRREFPDMQGLSPRNLGYMKAFCGGVARQSNFASALAKLTWYHNITLIQKVKEPGFQNRSSVLPPAAPLLRRDRFEDGSLQAGLHRADEFLPLGYR